VKICGEEPVFPDLLSFTFGLHHRWETHIESGYPERINYFP
jgi:hypothetical protein